METTPDLRRQFLYLSKVGLLAAIYFTTAKAGLSLSPVSGFATLVWPPTGIALAALFLFGNRLWPGIFLGAALVNLIMGAPPLVALGIGVGNTLEAVVGASLLIRFGFQPKLGRVQDVILLVSCAALFSTLVSATIGTLSLLGGGTIALSAYPKTWIAWWIGDMLGDLLIAALLLAWAQNHKLQLSLKQLVEVFLLVGLFLTIGVVILEDMFANNSNLHSLPYLLFPFLVWAALRFRVRLVVTLNVLLAALTVYAAIYNRGPFAGNTLSERLFSSQLFIGVTALTFLGFSAAMSERKRAQAEMSKLNHELEKALTRRTAELRKEKEIEKLKDEFVAIASHELKTPITSIKAFARILDKKLAHSKDKRDAQLAARIDTQADKLTRFVEELLDVSRIESGNLVFHKTKFDLNWLLEKTITDFQYTTQEHRIIHEAASLPLVTGDRNRLEQVVLNLLTNAVKYSPKANKVVVSSRVTRKELVVSVQDFGPGIPRKDRIKIFTRFYRTADSNRRKQAVSGIGLGLYIASEIIRQHGGKMWVASTSDRGSTFSFSLPL